MFFYRLGFILSDFTESLILMSQTDTCIIQSAVGWLYVRVKKKTILNMHNIKLYIIMENYDFSGQIIVFRKNNGTRGILSQCPVKSRNSICWCILSILLSELLTK